MSAYSDQWGRVMKLYDRKFISPAELKALGARHSQWFVDQGIEQATAFMTLDLQKYADHIEEFSRKAPNPGPPMDELEPAEEVPVEQSQ